MAESTEKDLMPSHACRIAALTALSILGSACSGRESGTSNDENPGTDGGTTNDADSGATSTATSLESGYTKATWATNVTVTYGDCSITYKSNGLPNHARDTEYAVPNTGGKIPTASTAHAADDPTSSQSYDVTLNTCPTYSATTTKAALGAIGYMISGASLYNPYEGDGSTSALASNFSVLDSSGNKVYFVDSGNGHPGPGGVYHYHGLPNRVTAEVDTAGGPSHVIGIALDGFPVYGNYDINGTEVTESNLDECNGITSPTPEFPNGIYHYVLLATTDGTSSMRCYHGTPATTSSSGGGKMGLRTPDLAGCGSNVALAQLDPSPAGRLWTGISRSFREPWASF